MTALDVEPDDSIVIDGVVRRIIAADIHMTRGDGIPDGSVRLVWDGGHKTVRHTKKIEKAQP